MALKELTNKIIEKYGADSFENIPETKEEFNNLLVYIIKESYKQGIKDYMEKNKVTYNQH